MVDRQTKTEDRRPGTAISMGEAIKMGLTIPQSLGVQTPAHVPGGYNLAATEQGRGQRDTVAWETLLVALGGEVRKDLQDAAQALNEAEQALQTVQRDMETHEAKMPTKTADIQKWATRRGELAGLMSAYTLRVAGTRQVYDRAATAARDGARRYAEQTWQQAATAHEEAEREYLRRKEEARRYLAEQNEARDTIRRLYARVTDGDLDMFR